MQEVRLTFHLQRVFPCTSINCRSDIPLVVISSTTCANSRYSSIVIQSISGNCCTCPQALVTITRETNLLAVICVSVRITRGGLNRPQFVCQCRRTFCCPSTLVHIQQYTCRISRAAHIRWQCEPVASLLNGNRKCTRHVAHMHILCRVIIRVGLILGFDGYVCRSTTTGRCRIVVNINGLIRDITTRVSCYIHRRSRSIVFNARSGEHHSATCRSTQTYRTSRNKVDGIQRQGIHRLNGLAIRRSDIYIVAGQVNLRFWTPCPVIIQLQPFGIECLIAGGIRSNGVHTRAGAVRFGKPTHEYIAALCYLR